MQKLQRRSRLQSHKKSVLLISGTIIVLFAVIFGAGMNLRTRNQALIAQEIELQAQLEEEEVRAEEIDELTKYVGTDEYIEAVAKEKLGLVKKGEILFRAE